MAADQQHPDYGIDAPGVVRFFGISGLFLLIWGLTGATIHIGESALVLGPMCITIGIVFILQSMLMLLYAKRGKFKHRDRMLASHSWHGDERVLDVGSGQGLLMIGAAKHLSTGRSEGLDVWSGKDLSGNTAERALRNADLEGVRHKLVQHTGSIVRTDFPDGYFDVVLSNLCLHNISKRTDRDAACQEIARILKPGGKAIISDFKHTGEYAKAFNKAGLRTGHAVTYWLDTFPPLTVIMATKSI